MKANLSIRKPNNWQDFETLCLLLWGEIWQCPGIKKFGRVGQNQDGVDICGKPQGETQYFGIQCKAKDENVNKKLTQAEIMSEVAKAQSFPMPLKKLIIATTANKDREIESFVFLKNEELISQGKFELELYCWEDIMLLIEQNRKTFNWYHDRQSYYNDYKAEVTFDNDLAEITLQPKFKRKVLLYAENINIPPGVLDGTIFGNWQVQKMKLSSFATGKSEYNYSYCSFRLKIHNIGNQPIEEFKLLLKFNGQISDIALTNKKVESFIPSVGRPKDIVVTAESGEAKIIPSFKRMIVPEDTYTSDEIFIKPLPIENRVTLGWKLLSKHGSLNGELNLDIKPEIERVRQIIEVDSREKRQTTEGEIEDFIEMKSY